MNLSFVSFPATDNVVLPGLFFTPSKPTKKVTVWLHGMGDNGVFYKTKLINELAKAHTDQGIAFLAFNNRGAHSTKRLKIADDTLPEEDRSFQGGTHYELITDSLKDIDGAVNFVKQQGYDQLFLAGISTGANKICVYDSTAKTNSFTKYVLAGPGDDVGLFFESLGQKRYWQALNHSAKLLSADKGLDLMPKYTGMYPFSAQSTWDILNPDGAYNTFSFYEFNTERLGSKKLFKEYTDIKLPTLVIIGEEDEYMNTAGGPSKALDTFLHHTTAQMMKLNDFELVERANHSFHDQETVFAKQVTDWLVHG